MALIRCGNGGEKFDISSLQAGQAAYCQSSSGTSGYTIADCVTSAVGTTISGNGNCVLFAVNADGYSKLLAKGQTDPNNAVVFGLNDDGTLECIYAARITTSNTHTVNTQGYKYLFLTISAGTSTNVNVQLTNS